jgi:hypothetical protein
MLLLSIGLVWRRDRSGDGLFWSLGLRNELK